MSIIDTLMAMSRMVLVRPWLNSSAPKHSMPTATVTIPLLRMPADFFSCVRDSTRAHMSTAESLMNSDGCTDMNGRLNARRAPLMTSPNSST